MTSLTAVGYMCPLMSVPYEKVKNPSYLDAMQAALLALLYIFYGTV